MGSRNSLQVLKMDVKINDKITDNIDDKITDNSDKKCIKEGKGSLET